MIPKKIHYCWFGRGELNKKAKNVFIVGKNIVRIMKLSNGMKIIYDINQNPYTKYTYDNKKFAFLSDYARLQIIEKEGGIYFDVDVEVVRSMDDLLTESMLFLDSKLKNILTQE